MKRYGILFLTSLVFCFLAVAKASNSNDRCLSVRISSDFTPEGDSLPPYIETKLPKFPFEVLYVVTKEYESVEDGTSRKYWYKGKSVKEYSKFEYVEERLSDLYPKTTYHGMVEDSKQFYDSVIMAYSSYCASDLQLTLDSEKQPHLTDDKPETETGFVSEENEIRVMQMTEDEVDRLENYNRLARGTEFATLEDILSVTGKGEGDFSGMELPYWSFISVVSTANCSHLYYRMMLCKDRAEAATKLYYLNRGAGMKGDAFRHVAVSMLLRYYLNEALSYMIMDVGHETVVNPNLHPCDTYMDLHNNRVGRNSMYRVFKKTAQTEKSEWLSYLLGIKAFVDNDSNAALMDWNRESSKSAVKRQCRSAGKEKYIYYKE